MEAQGGVPLLFYLAVSPQEQEHGASCSQRLACAAYRIGPSSSLLREVSLSALSNGLPLISDRNAPVISDAEKLAQAVLRECSRRKSAGAVLDFESPPTPDRLQFAKICARLLSSRQLALYVPELYAVPGSIPLINTAVSGGNFTEYLQDALRRYGHAALDVQRLCMDFSLPAPSGTGTAMRQDQLSAILRQTCPQVFFSQDLCAKYFTDSRNGQTHFILYDDGDTLRKKMQIGSSLGFYAAFLMYPEVSDLPQDFWKALPAI
jgi:hypothetical protein